MSSCGCCSEVALTPLLSIMGEILDQLVILNTGLGLDNAGIPQLTQIPVQVIDGATLGGSSGYNLGLVDAHDKIFAQIMNHTDGVVWVSLDNGVSDLFEVTAGSSQTLQLGSNRSKHSGNIKVRRDENSIPTIGEVLISAFY